MVWGRHGLSLNLSRYDVPLNANGYARVPSVDEAYDINLRVSSENCIIEVTIKRLEVIDTV